MDIEKIKAGIVDGMTSAAPAGVRPGLQHFEAKYGKTREQAQLERSTKEGFLYCLDNDCLMKHHLEAIAES